MVQDKAGGRKAPTCHLTPPRNAGRGAFFRWPFSCFLAVRGGRNMQGYTVFQAIADIFLMPVIGDFTTDWRRK